jgi:hypothetical protein
MKRAYVLSAKITFTVILVVATFVCVMLTLISLPVDTSFTRIWATVFSVSAIFFVVGVVYCWRSAGFSRLTISAVVYAFVLYGYVNWVALYLPQPFGYGVP